MKKSKYNHLKTHQGKTLLYNALTDEVAMLDPQIGELFLAHSPTEINNIHPDFYRFLKTKGFIIDNNRDETAECIEMWDREDNDKSSFSITINPTLIATCVAGTVMKNTTAIELCLKT